MKVLAPILLLAALAACEPTSQPRPEPTPEPKSSGISISGYGRVGGSTSF